MQQRCLGDWTQKARGRRAAGGERVLAREEGEAQLLALLELEGARLVVAAHCSARGRRAPNGGSSGTDGSRRRGGPGRGVAGGRGMAQRRAREESRREQLARQRACGGGAVPGSGKRPGRGRRGAGPGLWPWRGRVELGDPGGALGEGRSGSRERTRGIRPLEAGGASELGREGEKKKLDRERELAAAAEGDREELRSSGALGFRGFGPRPAGPEGGWLGGPRGLEERPGKPLIFIP